MLLHLRSRSLERTQRFIQVSKACHQRSSSRSKGAAGSSDSRQFASGGQATAAAAVDVYNLPKINLKPVKANLVSKGWNDDDAYGRDSSSKHLRREEIVQNSGNAPPLRERSKDRIRLGKFDIKLEGLKGARHKRADANLNNS